jgi:hypothetical protein
VRFVSGLLKFVAVVLAMMVVFALPVALLGQSAGRLLFSPSRIVDLLTDNLVNTEVMASLAEYTVLQLDPEQDAASQYGKLALHGAKQLEHEQWIEIIDLVVPPQLVSTTIEQILGGYYSWLLGNSHELEIWVDVEPWKETLGKNFVYVAETILAELPACNSAELRKYAMLAFNPETEIPMCEPPEPYYSILLDTASHQVPDELAEMGDHVNLIADAEVSQAEWIEAKEGLQAAQAFSQIGWVGVLFIFLIVILLGARSLPGVLKWAGWPILFAGGFLLVIALIFYAPGWTAGSSATTFANSDVPPMLQKPLRQVFVSVFDYLARPLLLQSVAMMLLGGMAIGAAVYIDYRNSAVDTESAMLMEEGDSPHDQATIIFDEPDDLLMEDNPEDDVDQKDDSQPSGMFG